MVVIDIETGEPPESTADENRELGPAETDVMWLLRMSRQSGTMSSPGFFFG